MTAGDGAMGRAGQQAKAGAFLEAHRGPDVVVLAPAWDPGSAALLVDAGFGAIATTSAGIAFSLGYADGERMGRQRMLDAVAAIIERVAVPVSADLEAGYGTAPEAVAETVRQAIGAGAVGAYIEDRPVDGTDALLEPSLATERIAAARSAADDVGVPFVVNARTDPYLTAARADPDAAFADAVRRANAYAAAGADCVFVPGVADGATIARLVGEIEAPLNVLAALSGTAAPPLAELRRLGVRRVSLGGSLALATFALVRRVARQVLDDGSFDYAAGALTNAEMNALLG